MSSATKHWRPDKGLRDFFTSNLSIAPVIPAELIADGQLHIFEYNGKFFTYTAGHDEHGPFVTVANASTCRPTVRQIGGARLQCIVGGKP